MNKQELFAAFDGRVSKSALHVIDDEVCVVGKYCRVSPMEAPDMFDLWLRNALSSTDGLGSRKLTHIIGALGTELPWCRLDGEAHVTVRKETILNNLAVLGIRKRRATKLSDTQRADLARRLQRANAKKAA
jgi:hypothetical protein